MGGNSVALYPALYDADIDRRRVYHPACVSAARFGAGDSVVRDRDRGEAARVASIDIELVLALVPDQHLVHFGRLAVEVGVPPYHRHVLQQPLGAPGAARPLGPPIARR